MKIFESNCTFEYSWRDVSIANWRKYCAWNDRCSHVVAVDTVSRRVDPNTGIVSNSHFVPDLTWIRDSRLPHPSKNRTPPNSRKLTISKLITERLITCRQSVPKWLLRIIGGTEVSYVHEISEVSRENQTVTMRSTNLTCAHILSVQETVIYSPDPTHPETKTNFNQNAQITAYGAFSRICNTIEDWSVDRFEQNAKKGREGFESVLRMSREAFSELKADMAKTSQATLSS